MNQTIFKILHMLDDRKVHYRIERTRRETVQIDATFAGVRAEIEIFEDGHIELAKFIGTEDVESGDLDMIKSMIIELA